ncbi:MAG TPA: hypothetical protein VFM51_03230 [Solirubrobacterales bacterium]|nr:hypothetical protein [Solirubrobacterales bacterium]
MSILDDAIREHLELKRQHGADEAELKRLEDEAFGPPGRPDGPDPFAEAPTEFMTEPGASGGPGTVEAAEEASRRRINIADLQEAPPAPAEPQQESRDEVADEDAPEAEDAPPAPAEDTVQAAPPAEEEPPAIEDEIEEPAADSADERQAIAEQPTELFDVGAELGTEDAPAPPAPSPSDEEIAEAEAAEPKLAPVEPATEIHASRAEAPEEPPAGEYEEDEEFWSDQRLSEELDQALEAPLAEGEEPAGDEEDKDDEYESESGHEDVLEDTPDFLEDAPEDDELWFEQRPPKDFDFDD